jgi:hypothetical protein
MYERGSGYLLTIIKKKKDERIEERPQAGDPQARKSKRQ